jgi:hypothetical protein
MNIIYQDNTHFIESKKINIAISNNKYLILFQIGKKILLVKKYMFIYLI